ncbi:hypothetical protein HaLaN_21704, partial [Haematococcus lacustris]
MDTPLSLFGRTYKYLLHKGNVLYLLAVSSEAPGDHLLPDGTAAAIVTEGGGRPLASYPDPAPSSHHVGVSTAVGCFAPLSVESARDLLAAVNTIPAAGKMAARLELLASSSTSLPGLESAALYYCDDMMGRPGHSHSHAGSPDHAVKQGGLNMGCQFALDYVLYQQLALTFSGPDL